MSGPDAPSLGPCCACLEAKDDVLTIVMLNRKAPIAGHGWGCVVCGLPPDGAVAVVCTRCHNRGAELVEACRGWPGSDGRVPIGELAGRHEHDLGRHPDIADEFIVEGLP